MTLYRKTLCRTGHWPLNNTASTAFIFFNFTFQSINITWHYTEKNHVKLPIGLWTTQLPRHLSFLILPFKTLNITWHYTEKSYVELSIGLWTTHLPLHLSFLILPFKILTLHDIITKKAISRRLFVFEQHSFHCIYHF